MRYNPVYKCRMCGEKYTDKSTSGDGKCIIPVLAGIEITGSSDVKYGHIVSIYSHHKHKDGSYGIADLQGYKEEDKC